MPVLRELGGNPFYDLGIDMYDGTKMFGNTMNETETHTSE
jgi:hypothetical protein